jgi:hypothetical protein
VRLSARDLHRISRWGALLILVLCAQRAQAQILPFLGEDRVGISAMPSLKIPADARGAALAGAMAATAFDASAAFWNPALLIGARDGAIFSHAPSFASSEYQFAAASYAITEADRIAASVARFGVPDMDVTTETRPAGTGQTFRARDISAALTYARRFTEQFSAGMTVRLADESMAGYSARALLVDAGTLYRTGLGSLRFAVTVQNFGGEIRPKSASHEEGLAAFYPPTVFTIGFGYEIIEDSTHRLTSALALNHPNDNSENLSFGLEYSLTPIGASALALIARAGTRVNSDDEQFSLGAGIRLPEFSGVSLRLDYALVQYERLGSIQRITAGVEL